MRNRTPAATRRYSTVADAAEYLGACEKTIRRLAAQGKLTLFRHGRRLVRVDLNELDELLTPKSGGGHHAH